MWLVVVIVTMLANSVGVEAYKNEYTVAKLNDDDELTTCTASRSTTPTVVTRAEKEHEVEKLKYAVKMKAETSPYFAIQGVIHSFLFGASAENFTAQKDDTILHHGEQNLIIYPSGAIFHSELFDSYAGVHMLDEEQVLRGRSRLLITKDLMQTAVNAFFIILNGNLTDVLKLPPTYVLRSTQSVLLYCPVLYDGTMIPYSEKAKNLGVVFANQLSWSPHVCEARTISMMKISREKLAATWQVVRNGTPTREVGHELLQLYRPLFKYVSAKEMTRLNLLDTRILSYIGTHPDLSRHQIGVVASKYLKINKDWTRPKYLNLMNNLICGVPISLMRKLTDDTYLHFSHQVFMHIRACEPLQRRFYLARMTKPQVLGKSYSWGAGDITRLGLLMAELPGKYLRAITPEAMSGITAQVMMEMQAQNLLFLTNQQTRYLDQKPLNILARKLKIHRDKMLMHGSASILCVPRIFIWAMTMICYCRGNNSYFLDC